MTVTELLQKLELIKDVSPEIIVCAWDADAQEVLPITGLLVCNGHVDICTDDMQS